MVCCNLGESGGLLVASALGYNENLSHLNLSNNNIGDYAAEQITAASNRSGFKLKHLDLSKNFLTD